MPTIHTNDIELHYQRVGSGSPVLLLAGMASDSASWQPVVAPLSQHFEVFTLDNRCTGRTQPANAPTSKDLMVQDVLALADACDLQHFSLVGHSMGAMLAWHVAATAPERVSGLVACSAAMNTNAARIELFETLARLRTELNEADWFRLLYQFLFSPDFFEESQQIDFAVQASMDYPYKQSLQAFNTQAQVLNTFLEKPIFESMPFPAMALTGANDVMFPPAALASFYSAWPAIEQRVIKNAAHSVHWENRAEFVDCVIEFLRR